MSSKRGGKQKQVDRAPLKSPTPEMQPSKRMEANERMQNHSSSSTYAIGPDTLGDFNIGADAWVHRQHEPIPQFLPPIPQVGDGGQGQGYVHLLRPLQPIGEDIHVPQSVGQASQGIANGVPPCPGAERFPDTSTSYGTETTYSGDASTRVEDWSPEALREIRLFLGDPWFGLEILTTTDGYPYSWLDSGTKRCVCQWLGCEKEDRTFENMSTLKKHQKNHQSKEAMPWKCSICDKTFALRHYLVRHLLTHTKVKAFGCDNCPARFARNDQLNKHRRSKSGCERAWRKESTLSSSGPPNTPGTGARPPQKRLPESTANSSISKTKGLASEIGEVDIASNSSFPFPSA